MYQAILFHPDGDYVFDFKRNSKEEVRNELENMGSRWIFYPIAVIASEKGRIVDIPEDYPKSWLKKSIKTIQNLLYECYKTDPDGICQEIEAGIPLSSIYA